MATMWGKVACDLYESGAIEMKDLALRDALWSRGTMMARHGDGEAR